MFYFLNFLLIVFAILFFILGYAYLNDKAEDIIMWSPSKKLDNIKDKKGYKKQQGKHCITMGVIFLLVPISIYLIEINNINKKFLYVWYFILAVVSIKNFISARKYFKR